MVLVQVEQFGTGTRYELEILHECGKKVKTKSQKVLGANSYVGEVTEKKLVGGGDFLPPILNRVKENVIKPLAKSVALCYH